METKAGHARQVIVLGIIATLGGCLSNAAVTGGKAGPGTPIVTYEQRKTAPSKRVSDRPGNTNGAVFVAMYHHIRAGKGDMFRTESQFRADLEHFYAMGFRPVLASEYLSNHMSLPPGASPIVMTFDDATPSQIQLRPDGSVDPNCAVGIWEDFAKTHPDFPVHATFFVLPETLWGPRKADPRKVKLVFDLGSELANHTINHPKLKALTDEKVKLELGTAEDRLEAMGQKGPHAMALPYGISPKHPAILKGFDWKGRRINFTGVFLVGANPAPSPTSPKFNRYRVPRIIAYSIPYGIDYWLKQVKDGHVKLYVEP